MSQRLTELHLHFQQCVRPKDLLIHLAQAKNIDWGWYEEKYMAAYGVNSQAKQLVERYQDGDQSVLGEFEQLCVFSDKDAGEFMRFLAKSNLFWAGSYRNDSLQDNEDELLAFASGIKQDFVAQGITYAEFRQSARPALLEMFDGDKDSLTMRLAVSLDRNNPWDGWGEVKELTLDKYGGSLTAIDFCNVEEGYPPKNMADFFDAVKIFNQQNPERALAILYHVGESFNDKSLESAIRWVQEAAEMGSHRLGHAIALGVDPAMYGEHVRRERVSERKDQIAYDLKYRSGLDSFGVEVNENELNAELKKLVQLPEDSLVEIRYDASRLDEIRRRQGYAIERIRATNAVIEVCPTSNMRIAGITNPAYHPIHRFVAEDLPFVISTDDPAILGITLEHELDWVTQNVKGGLEVRETLLDNAHRFRSELLSGREKQEL
jgi:adenosine deaminase